MKMRGYCEYLESYSYTGGSTIYYCNAIKPKKQIHVNIIEDNCTEAKCESCPDYRPLPLIKIDMTKEISEEAERIRQRKKDKKWWQFWKKVY